jgi:hypothetical protein
MKLVSQKKLGLLPEHRKHGIEPIVRTVRATLPVIEALRGAGSKIEPHDGTYTITLGHEMPHGIVAVQVMGSADIFLRLSIEPEYPGEIEAAWWHKVDWLPCPVCGAPVVWYEAGFVPGYRVCTGPKHHHSLAH